MAEDNSDLSGVGFVSLILTLSSSAWVGLGKIADPVSGEIKQDLKGAKYTIDLLLMLRDKTRGNLTDEEKKILDSSIAELQANFAETVFSKNMENAGDQAGGAEKAAAEDQAGGAEKAAAGDQAGGSEKAAAGDQAGGAEKAAAGDAGAEKAADGDTDSGNADAGGAGSDKAAEENADTGKKNEGEEANN